MELNEARSRRSTALVLFLSEAFVMPLRWLGAGLIKSRILMTDLSSPFSLGTFYEQHCFFMFLVRRRRSNRTTTTSLLLLFGRLSHHCCWRTTSPQSPQRCTTIRYITIRTPPWARRKPRRRASSPRPISGFGPFPFCCPGSTAISLATVPVV